MAPSTAVGRADPERSRRGGGAVLDVRRTPREPPPAAGAPARRARHRAHRVPGSGLPSTGAGWPLAAVGVVGLVGAHTLSEPLHDGEGLLAAQAFALLAPHEHLPVPAFSPHGIGALQ